MTQPGMKCIGALAEIVYELEYGAGAIPGSGAPRWLNQWKTELEALCASMRAVYRVAFRCPPYLRPNLVRLCFWLAHQSLAGPTTTFPWRQRKTLMLKQSKQLIHVLFAGAEDSPG